MDKIPRKPVSMPTAITPTNALSHLLQNNITKEAYQSNHLISKEHGADIWPTYEHIVEEKECCEPQHIDYQEMSAIVPLQDRLRHNDKCLIEIRDSEIKELLEKTPEDVTINIKAVSKIGFDGSTGHSIYSQALSLENQDTSDASLLATCLVPFP
jgi:hypothetical protein